MQLQDGFLILIDLLKNGKKSYHKWYDRTVQFRTLYIKLITGEGLNDLMKQFVRREDEKMFNQRKNITQHIITSVTKNLMDVTNKIPHSNSITRVIGYKDDQQHVKAKEMEEILSTFWGTKTFDDYCATRFFELNYTDPNTFVVYDFKAFDSTKEKAKPYPFEVNSEQAVKYEYENNVLQYLVAKLDIEIKYMEGTYEKVKAGSQYIMYMDNDWIKLTQVINDRIRPTNDYVIFEFEGSQYVKNKDEIYLYETGSYNLGRVPAMRVGYNRDMFTNGDIYVNPFNAATPLLLKTIKVNSELDLTMALIAFPQTLRYNKKCFDPNCINGQTRDGKDQCPVCKGTGYEIPTSVQDAITLPLPSNPEQMLNLDQLLVFKSPAVDIIQFQKDYIDSLTAKCKSVVFNSGIFDKVEIAETATGKNIDLQNVYDSLYPFALKMSDFFEFGVKIQAIITSFADGLEVKYSFGRDFKFKTKDDLLYELKLAKDSGASQFLIRQIQDDIARIIYADDPFMLRKYFTMQIFYPFSGQSAEEIHLNFVSGLITEFYKVLNTNYGIIFDMIDLDMATGKQKENFYDMEKSKQWAIITAKVNEIQSQLKPVQYVPEETQ